MDFLKKEDVNGKTVITTETVTTTTKGFFRKTTVGKREQRKFIAESVTIPGKYWSWLEMPGLHLVPDNLSLQLDAWNRV